MAYGYAQDHLRLPLIRKVFRQADKYICGLCKSDYKNYGQANSCMNQCWFDVHNFYPVVQRKRSPTSWSYRCLFCCRDYNNEINAYSCAKRCVGTRNSAQLREQLLNDMPLPPPQRPVSRLLMMNRMVPAKPVAKKPAEMRSNADGPNPDVQTFGDGSETGKSAFTGLHKKSFALTVTKQGSKYLCEYCKTIHKEHAAAEECFAKHFNAEGFEKIVSVDPNL